MEIDPAIAFTLQNIDDLTDWERRFCEKMHGFRMKGYSLTSARAGQLLKIVNDLEAGKKVLTKELHDVAVSALNYRHVLKGVNEEDFCSKVSKLKPNDHKLTSKERGWLYKIESRLHKEF